MMAFYNKKHSGFTLIELMIVVAIVAILATVALPSYQRSVEQTRRTDAKIALVTAVTAQEKWYFQKGTYSTDVNDIGGDSGSLISSEGYYAITITNAGAGCVGGGGVSYNCFTLTATPVAGGRRVR